MPANTGRILEILGEESVTLSGLSASLRGYLGYTARVLYAELRAIGREDLIRGDLATIREVSDTAQALADNIAIIRAHHRDTFAASKYTPPEVDDARALLDASIAQNKAWISTLQATQSDLAEMRPAWGERVGFALEPIPVFLTEMEEMIDLYRVHLSHMWYRKYQAQSTPDPFAMISCVPPDTLIETSDGLKQIQRIEVGDQVVTHKGGYGRVSCKMKRKASEKINVIKPYYTNIPLRISDEHPVMVLRGAKWWIHDLQKRGRPSPTGFPLVCQSQTGPEWVEAKDVKAGDVLVFPRNQQSETPVLDIERHLIFLNLDLRPYVDIENCYERGMSAKRIAKVLGTTTSNVYALMKGRGIKRRSYSKAWEHRRKPPEVKVDTSKIVIRGSWTHPIPKKLRINGEIMRLFGYYLAEGCAKQSIRWTFHPKEDNYADDVINILDKTFGFKASKYRADHELMVQANSNILALLFKKLFGGYAHNKRIPHWLLDSDEELLRMLVRGFWRGDGCFRKDRKLYSATTTSREMAFQLRLILHKLGVIPALYKVRAKGRTSRVRTHTIRAKHDRYTLEIPAFFNKAFERILGERNPEAETRNVLHGFLDDERVYVLIREVTKEDYEGHLYNLEVSNGNSYTANGPIVHNCFVYTSTPEKFKQQLLRSALDYLETDPEAFPTLGFALSSTSLRGKRKGNEGGGAFFRVEGLEVAKVDADELGDYEQDEIRYYVAFYRTVRGVVSIYREYYGRLEMTDGGWSIFAQDKSPPLWRLSDEKGWPGVLKP